MNYSKAIRIARSLADLTQGQLADRAEIDRSYLSLIESGKRQPTTETIEKIARALKLPFHLLSLLGSEEADAKKVNQSQIESLSLALTRLLMQVDSDETDNATPKAPPSRSISSKEHEGAGVPARGRARNALALS